MAAAARTPPVLLLLLQLSLAWAFSPDDNVARFPEDGNELRWEDTASRREAPPGVVSCGYQYGNNDELPSSERVWVARVYRDGSLIPGRATYAGASAALASTTFRIIHSFEVAVANPSRVKWVPAAQGSIPSGAPVTGIMKDGQALYSCRFHREGSHNLSIACGAVHLGADRCVAADVDGTLASSGVYEVLVMQSLELPPPPPPPPPPTTVRPTTTMPPTSTLSPPPSTSLPPATTTQQTQHTQTLPTQTLAPQTQTPQTLAPLTQTPQTLAPLTQTPQTLAPQTQTPQTLAPQTQTPSLPPSSTLPPTPNPNHTTGTDVTPAHNVTDDPHDEHDDTTHLLPTAMTSTARPTTL